MKINPPGMPRCCAVAICIFYGGWIVVTAIWIARQLGWL